MKFMIRGRQRSKTTQLLDWMELAPEDVTRVAVCHSLQEVNRLQRLAADHRPDLESWQFISVDELPTYRPYPVVTGQTQIEIGIDNLDLILERVLKCVYPIDMITATGELV